MKNLLKHLVVLLVASTSAFAAVAPVLPASHVGSYEALLFTGDEATGTPAGFITLTTTSTGKATGKLTIDDSKVYPFLATFGYDAGSDLATTSPAVINISRGATLPAFGLSLAIKNLGQALESTLTLTGATNRVATTGAKLTPRAKTATDKLPGKYTLAFTPSGNVAVGPSGSGYAAGTVDAAGVLKLAGKLSDGTALTASLLPDANRGYRLYLNALRVPGSYFAGKISLVSNGSDGFHVVTATAPAADFWYAKPGNRPKDPSYRAGFGPLPLLLTMEPWVLPGKGQTLAQLLGVMTVGGNFQFGFDVSGAGLDLDQYLGTLPLKLTIDAKNALVPVFGDNSAPSSVAEWAKIWTGKVDPATGVFSGTFTLTDIFDPDGPSAEPIGVGFQQLPLKIVKRKVAFQGVLLNTAEAGVPLAAGNFILPPVDAKTQTTLAGDITIPDVLTPLGTGTPPPGLISSGTAGTYEVNPFHRIEEFDLSKLPSEALGIKVNGKMSGLPVNDTKVPFTISPDLTTLTINGRKVPLAGDSRPVSLLFTDATKTNYKNTLTVVVYLNTSTGQASGIFALYVQHLSATYNLGAIPGLPSYVPKSITAPFPALAIYDNQSAPVKVK
ncbi:hypothetical protein [Brevifollis gellanilyticus]|uniref:MBG domain-containing protein n=1 Tax=Brevifollis gellanilyticus TaxID=748831 RepID=A0A512M9Q7_9BACT|nr:hypothetical protein [Brevifollis gellanilyticus]GEP43061.1 hypothetical protein BGE01nite_23520 [Brevifollis gellanilyticus]